MSGTVSAPRANSDSISRRVSPHGLPASTRPQRADGLSDGGVFRLGGRIFKVKRLQIRRLSFIVKVIGRAASRSRRVGSLEHEHGGYERPSASGEQRQRRRRRNRLQLEQLQRFDLARAPQISQCKRQIRKTLATVMQQIAFQFQELCLL